MILGLSPLRWAGLVLGLALILIAAARLRRYRGARGPLALYGFGGVLLVTVSLMPQLVNLPADVFALRGHPAGRLITLLILATTFLFLLVIWNRAKLDRLAERHDRLLRALALDAFLRDHPGLEWSRIWLVIPAYNEADNLSDLLPTIGGAAPESTHVLVVDDGSDDATADVARACGASVVRMPVNAGGGTSLRTGFDLALHFGADCVVTMDGDGQHDPCDLQRLIEPLAAGEAEVVIGSRTLGVHEPASRARALGISLFNTVISRLLGIQVTDCASGYRAIASRALAQLQLVQSQYHTAELIIDAAKRGLRIAEVPITIGPRWSGSSKKGRDWSYGAMFLRTIIKTWLR